MRLLNGFIESYSSIWYGILIAVVVVVALFFVVVSMQGGNKRFSPLSYVLGVALVAFLSYQCSLLVGAIMFKSDCSDISSIINDFTPNKDLRENSDDIRRRLRETEKENPYVKNFIDVDEIDKSLPDGAVGDAVMAKVHSYLNWFIFRRVMWSLVACVIIVFLIFYTMENTPRGRTRRTPGHRTNSRRKYNDDF